LRSILREKSQDFFCILQYDQADWLTFWNQYCFENRDFMSGYTKTLELDTPKIEKILTQTKRPFLDKIKQKNDEIKHLKQRSAKALNLSCKELELEREDFVIYLIGALGIQDTVSFSAKEKVMILIDLVSLFKNNRIENLEEIVLSSAKQARRNINQTNQEVY